LKLVLGCSFFSCVVLYVQSLQVINKPLFGWINMGSGTVFLDLHSSDHQSDNFLRKINRARFALARTDSIRSVSFSIYAKPPYRRAASVPMHLLTKTLPNQQAMKGELLLISSCLNVTKVLLFISHLVDVHHRHLIS